MTAEQVLRKALVEIHLDDTTYKGLSNGIFLIRAPSPAALPYSTYVPTSKMPVRTLQTTTGWVFKVQVKHWGVDARGLAGTDVAQSLNDASTALLHARSTQDYNQSPEEVLARLNSLTGLGGWKFLNAEIVSGIPFYLDKIGDKEVWCTGHVFEFWLEYAA